MLHLEKYIFNISFPLDQKLCIFYAGKDIFQKMSNIFSTRNRTRKNIRTAGERRFLRAVPRDSPRGMVSFIFYSIDVIHTFQTVCILSRRKYIIAITFYVFPLRIFSNFLLISVKHLDFLAPFVHLIIKSL